MCVGGWFSDTSRHTRASEEKAMKQPTVSIILFISSVVRVVLNPAIYLSLSNSPILPSVKEQVAMVTKVVARVTTVPYYRLDKRGGGRPK